MSPKKSFADAVADAGSSLRKLLTMLELHESSIPCEEKVRDCDKVMQDKDDQRPGYSPEKILQQWLILETLASTPSVAKALVNSSAWLELLGIISGYFKFTNLLSGRQGAAKTLSRLLWDPNSNSIAGKKLDNLLQLI